MRAQGKIRENLFASYQNFEYIKSNYICISDFICYLPLDGTQSPSVLLDPRRLELCVISEGEEWEQSLHHCPQEPEMFLWPPAHTAGPWERWVRHSHQATLSSSLGMWQLGGGAMGKRKTRTLSFLFVKSLETILFNRSLCSKDSPQDLTYSWM